MRVIVRVRPLLDTETENPDNEPIVSASSSGRDQKILVTAGNESREFHFDQVFGPEASQADVYDSIGAPLVQHVLQGYNGSLLAYGQTRTGKTYTMGILGRVSRRDHGIVPRALASLFDHFARAGHTEWSLTLTFVQIYMENVFFALAEGMFLTT